MTAIIHIGMPKTGTTSIQYSLFEMQEDGMGEFAYLSGDGHVNGNRTSKVLCRPDETLDRLVATQPWIAQEDFSQQRVVVRAALAAEIAAAKDRKIVFSSEDLVFSGKERLIDFHSLFLPAGSDIRAIGYVRTPKSFMESAFQQRVKTGLGRFVLHRLYPEYRLLFEKFDNVFGRENVDLRVFEQKKLLHGCAVRDFANRAGIDVPEDRVIRRNDALSRQALSLLFVHRKFSPLYGGGGKRSVGNNALLEKLGDLDGMKVRFHSSIVAPLLEEHKEDLAWMEDRLGVSLTENLDADDATAIRSEKDLLDFAPDALQWLSEQLEDHPLSQQVLSGEPEVVANGVHALYQQAPESKVSRAAAARIQTRPPIQEEKALTVRFLAKTLLKLDSGDELADEQANTLLTEALAQIRAKLVGAAETGLAVEGWGAFSPHAGPVDPEAKAIFLFHAATGLATNNK